MVRSNVVAEAVTTLYRAYGRAIESDLPLPMLPVLRGGASSVTVRRALDVSNASPTGDGVFELTDEDGAAIYHLERSGDRYVWSYPDIGRFVVAHDGRLIEWAADESKLSDAAAAVSGPVLGFALQLQGQVSLHASAVVIDDAAVGLLAPSGYGKSTLAAAFLARGAALLSDDVLAVEIRDGIACALPSHPSMKLWPDALGRLLHGAAWEALPRHASWLDKRVAPATELGAVCDEARPLGALYVVVPVAPEGEIVVRQLHGRDALLALLAHGYNSQLLALERELLARQFEALRRVAETAPVYALACPRDLDRLGEVVDAIVTGTADE